MWESRLVQEDEQNPDYRQGLARAEIRKGYIYGDEKICEQAIARFDRLTNEKEGEKSKAASYMYDKANGMLTLSVLQFRKDLLAEAQKTCEEVCRIMERAINIVGDRPPYRATLAKGHDI